MKKRLISMILALVLILGVVAVPTVNADAAAKKTTWTKLTLKSNKTVPVTFYVTKDNKNDAAKNMSRMLGLITKNGSKFNAKVDGKKVVIKNKKGVIYVDNTKLTTYVKEQTDTTKTTVKITYNTSFKKVLKGINLVGSSKYSYKIKVGTVTFTNLKVSKGKMTFTENSKKRTAVVKKGNIYVKGDVTKAKFVKRLKSAKVVTKATKVKAAY